MSIGFCKLVSCKMASGEINKNYRLEQYRGLQVGCQVVLAGMANVLASSITKNT